MADLKEATAQRAMVADKARLLREDRKFRPIVEALRKHHPKMGERVLDSTLLCMNNLREWIEQMDEATRASNIGNFINYGFELIAAVMPNLLAHEFVSVQPMTRRVGEIFYMKYRYGTTKGTITSTDTLFDPLQSGQGGEQYYTSERVYHETVGTGDGAHTHYEYTLEHIPVRNLPTDTTQYVYIGTAVEHFTPDTTTPTTLNGSAGGTGTINYTTGEVTLDFNANVGNGVVIYADYSVDFEENPDNIPEIDLQVWSDAIEAKSRKLRVQYTLDSAYDLQQAFGRSAETDLSAALAAAIRAEIDAEIFYDLYTNAYASVETWDRDLPMGVSWRDHKYSIIDVILRGKNMIFDQTRRAEGNFIVAGIEVCNVIESLETRFKRTAQKPLPGPHIVGYLDDMPVVKNPYFSTKTYLIGYRGDLWLDTGYVYAPYMPLYTTPTITLDDFTTRKGMGTRYAKKLVNSRMYVNGAITGEPVPTPA